MSNFPILGRPRILVLLAAHNGAQFLQEQIDSVLQQLDVDVTLVVSDDASEDNTVQILQSNADLGRLSFSQGMYGSAQANFFHLIRSANTEGFDAIAFSDQDDIWLPWKLSRHYSLLTQGAVPNGCPFAAVSSNVTAFHPTGMRALINKSQPQRRYDYLFESAGPGSTFLLSHESFSFVQAAIADPEGPASASPSHDWLIYALLRANGQRWHIDTASSVDYRQHSGNVLGANEGWKQGIRRLHAIRSGSYRRNVLSILHAVTPVADQSELEGIRWITERVAKNDLGARRNLSHRVTSFRRRTRDRMALAVMIITGIW